MSTTHGSATSHIGGTTHLPLPMAADHPPTAHRPWCRDCKTKHDADQLDRDGRCQRCAHIAAARAAAPPEPPRPPSRIKTSKGETYPAYSPEDVERRYAPTQTPQAAAPTAPAAPMTVEPPLEQTETPVAAGAARGPRPAAQLAGELARAEHILTITAGDQAPALRLLRLHTLAAIDALGLLHEQLTQTPLQGTREDGNRKGKPEPSSRRSGRVGAPTGPHKATNVEGILNAHQRGLTVPQIALEVGHGKVTVRRILRDHGHTPRDGRAGGSGGRNRITYSPEQIEAVRASYVDEQHTIAQTAAHVGLPIKAVTTILHDNGIPRRPDAFDPRAPRRDNANNLKAQLDGLGIPSLELKRWGLAQGVIQEIARGLPSQRLIDAWLEHHPSATNEGEPAA